jgi:hypothetical protein
MLVPYPVELPSDGLMLLLDKVRGKDVDNALLVQVAWNVTGYGLGRFLPVEKLIGSENVSEEEALEQLIAANQSKQGLVSSIVLSVVLKSALKILANYIS